MDKKSQEELEKPAKVYQMDALNSKLDTVITKLEEQSTYMKGTVTIQYLQEALKAEREKFAAELELMRQKYDPYIGNAKWASRTAIGAFIIILVGYFVGLNK